MQIVEHAHARFRLDPWPQLLAPRFVNAYAKAGLRDMQDALAAAAH